MGKKTIHNNYRVVVEPRRLGDVGIASMPDSMFCSGEEDRQRQYRERCEEIVAQIKRHADNVGHAFVEFDTEHTCEHCGYAWTESGNYNGGCCDKDEEAEQARRAAA